MPTTGSPTKQPSRTRSARAGTARSRYPESSAWDSPGFLLWHATLEWQRRVAVALKPLQLTHVQFVLLASLAWLERRTGAPSQRELADHAGTDAMMTSQVVRTLEQSGLLVREPDPVDARVKRLRTTERGAALARDAVEIVEAVDNEVFDDVAGGPSLRAALRRVARRDEQGRLLDDHTRS